MSVSDTRCPRCGAVLPQNAQWCSLCYFDLRAPVAPPEPPPPPVPPPPVQPPLVQQQPAVPVQQQPTPFTAAPMLQVTGAPLPAAAPTVEQPAAPTNPQAMAEPTWPCPKCGNSVLMSLDHCTVCGAGFLADAADSSIKVPVFGDVGKLTSGRKAMLGVLVTVALIVFLIVIATIGGKLL
jgi:hypothetical protein